MGPKIDMAVQARPCLPNSHPYTSAGQVWYSLEFLPSPNQAMLGFGRYDYHFWGPISVSAHLSDPSIVQMSIDYHTKQAGFPFPVSAC